MIVLEKETKKRYVYISSVFSVGVRWRFEMWGILKLLGKFLDFMPLLGFLKKSRNYSDFVRAKSGEIFFPSNFYFFPENYEV